MAEQQTTRRLSAILAADVVGYSSMMGIDEAGTLAALREVWQQTFNPAVTARHGRIVKMMGDGALVEFPSVVSAVECAAAIQRAMGERNLAATPPIQFRIGINLGDVIVEGDDIFGDGVNIAARIEAIAKPGGVSVSATVRENVGNKLELAFDDTGEHSLKNIEQPIRVYNVVLDAALPKTAAMAHGSGTRTKGSVAVLPFSNMGGDPEQDYFAEGIAEDILTELSRFRNLFVIARNSSFSFKGKGLGTQEIAKALNVEYIVAGGVRRIGKRVRVAAQLIHSTTGQELWAERYDREVEDIFVVQDEVVRTIVVTLESRLQLAIANDASKRDLPSLAAYECVQLAKKYVAQHDAPRAMPFVERALQLDAEYAVAHAMRAATFYVQYLGTARADTLDEMAAAARTAIGLDDGDSSGHALLGMALILKRQYELAASHLERAISLNPANATAMAYQAELFLRNGDFATALKTMDELLQRDPIPATWHWEIRGMALLMLRRYHEAILAFSRQAHPFWYIHGYLAMCQARLGHLGEAKAEIEKLLSEMPEMTIGRYPEIEPFRKQEDRDFMAESLRLAGLPE
ncbi:tetratricopeptide repeat protein [Mesorhizobium sp. WSM4303]|uniref:adenylate/guanylate cyclase domain-containing protein n=1 Tax=unclassified Mesorhizobium TaxID=325217 RepID=UPI00115EF400|nr:MULTISPECIES: adenylate/guanylate cyclase domain-containing protein [unclassified Mesorhizobium]TRC93381.1 tetratricopeptide repeat protein [Mesorhizobium sp. WSM4303]TRC93430.1 tetratricopeptide repeat protein [Mesorhizobium sp. WSM4306]